jgi:hypothetical protein
VQIIEIPKMLATLSYIAESSVYKDQKSFEIIGLTSEEVSNERCTNVVYETQNAVSVTDTRSLKKPVSLDAHGFKCINHTSKYIADARPFNSADENHGTVNSFLEETVAMTKEELGASAVYVHD